MRTVLAVGLLFFAACSVDDASSSTQSALLVSPDLVISDVFGGGGNTGAPFNQDFAVLFNRGTDIASLSGLKIYYASATGTFSNANTVSAALSGSLFPGATYLMGFSTGAVGTALPTVDLSATMISLGSTGGKLAIAAVDSPLVNDGCDGGCDASTWIDLVGWGTANEAEGTKAGTTSNTTGLQRKLLGCTDTGDNSADFTVAAPPTPRNHATTPTPCTPVDFAGVDLTTPPDLTPPRDLTAPPAPDLMGYSLLLNEVRWNPPGSDTGQEYVELLGTGAIPINTYLVSVDGDGASAGRINYVHDLSGLTVGSNGLLLVAATTSTFADVEPATTVVTDAALAGSPIQNGTESVLVISSPVPLTLVAGTTNYATLANITILDSLTASDGGTAYGAAVVAACPATGSSPIDGASRIVGNTTPQSVAAWYAGQSVGSAPSFLGLDDVATCSTSGPATWSMSPGRLNNDPQTAAPDLAAAPDLSTDDGPHADLAVDQPMDLGADMAAIESGDLAQPSPSQGGHSSGCAMAPVAAPGGGLGFGFLVCCFAAALLIARRRRAQTTNA